MAVRGILGRQRREYRTPEPHPSGARAPKLPGELVPNHVAIVMDGNGRWAKERGLPRTEGHKVGAERVLDVLQGAVEMGSAPSRCTPSPPRTGSARPTRCAS